MPVDNRNDHENDDIDVSGRPILVPPQPRMCPGLPATLPRGLAFTLLLAWVTGCLSDLSGPFGHHLTITPAGLSFAALRDTARLAAVELGPGAPPLPPPVIEYASDAPTVATVDSTGLVTSRGNGVTWIVARVPSGEVDSVAVTVVQQASGVIASRDTFRFEALGEVQSLGAIVVDRLGAAIPGLAIEYTITDTSIASIVGDGKAYARRNGLTAVRIAGAGQLLSVVIQVQQRPVLVLTDSDSLRFVALGETRTIVGIAVDSLGHAVPAAGVAQLAVEDTSVLELVDSVTVRAKGNGQTVLRFSSAGLPVEQAASVSQVPDTIVVSFADTLPILVLGQGSQIPLTCQARDRNGYPIAQEPTVTPSSSGRLSGSTCHDLRAQRSGLDTLRVSYGPLSISRPVALAVRATVSLSTDIILQTGGDQIGDPWAPSADTAPDGTIELYFGNYVYDSSYGANRANLVRLLSSDGLHFQYDTLILPYGSDVNADDGRGIENAVVFADSGGSGWRMLYAGGNQTSGWQVFGATSTDRTRWVKTGPVIGNGYPATLKPAGEGLLVDRLSGGTWRLVMGAYEPTPNGVNSFSITEWHSADQSQWSFVRTLVSAVNMPPTGNRVVYSPAIRQIGPSMWRMVFTADNFSQGAFVGGTSSIWSAVSSDFEHWQLEGVFLSQPGANLMYSALARDNIYLVRRGVDGLNHLATATVQMP